MKIKNFFSIFLLLIFVNKISSQNRIAGKKNETTFLTVTYKSGTYKTLEDINVIKTDSDKKSIINRKYVQDSLEFVLYCNKEKSLYKVVDRLDVKDGDPEFEIEKAGLGSHHIYYTNTLEKEIIKHTDLNISRGIFNISYPFDKFNWNVTSETKIINGYLCYKATAHYEEFKKFINKTLLIDAFAWFTPKLPFPFGPRSMHGLPGLIMEGSIDGKTYYYVSKIVLNNKLKSPIEKPKGKLISSSDFEDMEIKELNKIKL